MEVEEQRPFHPRTSVAFAATPAFTRAYPDEVAKQQELFNKPSWAVHMQQQQQEPGFTPAGKEENQNRVQVADWIKQKTAAESNPLLTAAERTDDVLSPQDALIGAAVIGVIILGGYLLYKYAWTSSPPTPDV